MPEQHAQRPHNESGREESSRKRTRSPQPQRLDTGRDERRLRISRSPSSSSNQASTAISSGRSTSPQFFLNAADIFSQMRPEWQIEPKSHLPLHLSNCSDCTRFAQHVKSETSGGALEIFNQKQRHHWREILDREIEDRCLDAYRRGQRDNDDEMSKLKDDLAWYRRRVENLEREMDDLGRRNNTPRASYQHGGSQRPSTSFGRGGSRPLRAERKRSPSPKRHQLPAPVASSSKRQLTPPPQEMAVDTEPNPVSATAKGKEVPKLLRRMYMTDEEDDDDDVSINSGNMDIGGDRDSPPQDAEETEEPSLPSMYIGDPAPFRLHKNSKAFQCKHGHACIDPTSTRWNTTSTRLFRKRYANKHFRWMWGSGFPMQMAREASLIPFDQRSLAQRWTVQQATRDGFLPLNDISKEPDVEHLAKHNLLPEYIRRDDDRFNVKDVTAWLLFKMMEPEETELVDWFWWTSCKLFSELGRYANEMSVLGLRDDGSGLAPLRFVQKGEPKQEDIIRHFKLCGVRVQDANEHLLDFSKRYISKVSPPMAIDWSRIPPSKPRVSRPSLNQRRKRGDKAYADRDMPIPGHSQEQPVQPNDGSLVGSHISQSPAVYAGGWPSGSTSELPSNTKTGSSSRPPTNEDRMHIG